MCLFDLKFMLLTAEHPALPLHPSTQFQLHKWYLLFGIQLKWKKNYFKDISLFYINLNKLFTRDTLLIEHDGLE